MNRAELEKKKVNELEGLAKELDLSLKGKRNKQELIDLILSASEVTLPQEIELEIVNEDQLRYSEAEGSKFQSTGDRRLLPISTNELMHFWERGYICHPRVLLDLVKRTHSSYEPCEIISYEQIEMRRAYGVKFDLLIEFGPSFGQANDIITLDWLTPCTSIKRLIVKDEDKKEEVVRVLNATHKGYSEDYPVQIEDMDILYYDRVQLEERGEPAFVPRSIIEQFIELDSVMGAIAVSSFVERTILFKGRHFFKTVPVFGTIGGNLFDLGPVLDLSNANKAVLSYIVKVVQARYGRSPKADSHEYSLSMLDRIKQRDNESIIDEVFRYQLEKNENISRSQLREIKAHFDNYAVLDAVRAVPIKNRDPFLIFAALLNQYMNIGSPASSDRQSFLFAMNDLYKSGDIKSQEMIILGYLLGYYLSYSLTWNPVLDERISGTVKDNDLNKMRYPDLWFTELLIRAVPVITQLKCSLYFDHSALLKELSKEMDLTLMKDIPKRSVTYKEGRIEFNDDDLNLFEQWLSRDEQTKERGMLILMLGGVDNIDLEKVSSIFLSIQKDLNGTIDRFRKSIAGSTVSLEQRELIRTICK